MIGLIALFVLGVSALLIGFIREFIVVKRHSALFLKAKIAVGRMLPAGTEVEKHQRVIYAVRDGQYLKDANDKKVKATYTDSKGQTRIAKSVVHRISKNGKGPLALMVDDQGKIIPNRCFEDATQQGNEDRRMASFMDNITDESWEALMATQQIAASNSPEWIELLDAVHSQWKDVAIKLDHKLFGEDALLWIDKQGNGRVGMACVVSTGQLKVPSGGGIFGDQWEDISLKDAIESLKVTP